MYTTIETRIEDRVAILTLNRPEFGNAFAKESYTELVSAVSIFEKDDSVGSLLITGKGKHFSAGGDIKRFKGLIDSKTYLELENIHNAGRMSMAIRHCTKPVVAMVNGAAAGAGMSLALACDFRVLAPSSKLVMAFIKLGLSGDSCGMYLLQKLVGVAKTTELMMLGDTLTGQQAHTLGLVTVLAGEETLLEESLALAKKLAAGPIQAFKRQKKLMSEYFFADMAKYMEKEGQFMAECSRTDDFACAVNAFLEKKQPEFSGK